MAVIVSTIDLVKRYTLGKLEVVGLQGVSLSIEEGEFLAIAGPSGSGKSTLLNLLGCLDTPTSGSLTIAGTRTSALSQSALTRLRLEMIGFVFQGFNLVSALSALENIELPLLLQGKLGSKARRARVSELLEAVGLREHAKHRPGELSGGQQQRVAIARALVASPALVLADEPTANLDSETGRQIVHSMKDLNQRYGTTFVFSTHDSLIMSHATRLVHLADGKLVAPPAERAASAVVLRKALA